MSGAGAGGLIPDVTESLETQLSRVLEQLKHKATDLDRFISLMNLLDTNETLFYRTLMSEPARFLDIVYDPTIGEACLKPFLILGASGGRLTVEKGARLDLFR